MKPANPEPANSEHDKAPVLIVVDTENYSPATIQLAVEIAASLQTGLRGLFIENENLLRVAELPFSREITSTSGDRPLNVAVIQRSMRARVG